MNRKLLLVVSALILGTGSIWGQKLETVKLPPPQTKGGMPLMQALQARKSSRVFSAKELPPQLLSNLLWAAFGVNRPASQGTKPGKRTAPSACNWQEVDIYTALPAGVYLYDAKKHVLEPVLAKDLRAITGVQKFVGTAPLCLIYVADYSRMAGNDRIKDFYAATDTGFVSQNVYLFCASENLATVVLGMVDKLTLRKAMNLRAEQKIILTQPVGFPK